VASGGWSRTIRALKSVLNDALYRGSLLLLVNTAVLSGFGFAFWALAARTYPAPAVGAFSGITAGVGVLASVASLGWPNTITRHLANAGNATELISIAAVTMTTVGGAITLAVMLGLGSHLPASLHLQEHGGSALLVTALVVLTALGGLTDAGLVSTRSTQALLSKNLVASILKVVALFLLARLGSSGLLLAYGASLLVSTALSAVTLARRLQGGMPGLASFRLLREHLSVTAGNYLATVLGILPSTVVPLEVLLIRGAADTARFTAAFMMAGFLNIIPSTVARVLFAEASRAGVPLGPQLRKSLRGVYGLLVPALIVVLAVSPLVLHIFGSAYAAAATAALRVLALSALVTGGNYLIDSVLIARDRVTAYIVMNGVNAVLVLGCVGVLLPRGLTAGAVGWTLAQGLSLVIGMLVLATGGAGRHRTPADQMDAEAAGQRRPYQRLAAAADAAEPEIRQLLETWPAMPTTMIAQQIGWGESIRSLLDRVTELRSGYLESGPQLSRRRYAPGGSAQCGLWFPPVTVPVGSGQVRSAMELPVLTMVTGYSRWLTAVLIPSWQAEDLFAGWWQLLAEVGGVPQLMTWDPEEAVGRLWGAESELTAECRKFAHALGTTVVLGTAGDHQTRALIERAHAYLEKSFLPGRSFASPADFSNQLRGWLTTANTRHRSPPNRSPAELIAADVRAMLPLPAAPPATGWLLSTQVGRESFVYFDGNHYSVHPAATGRTVEIVADLAWVSVLHRGRRVARHRRSWASGQAVTD
jgi:O-antigen/teichoic acid export membrane protein